MATNMRTEVVQVPQEKRGLVIGRNGTTIREIERSSGVMMKVKDDGVHLRGTQQQIEQARQMILTIIQQTKEKKDVNFDPKFSNHLIGPGGTTVRGIQDATGTKIQIDKAGVAHITGPTQENIQQAEQEILDLVSVKGAQINARRKYPIKHERFALVDSTCVSEENYFRLQEIQTDDPEKVYHKLVMEGEKTDKEKEMDITELQKTLLNVLREIRKEVDDTGNIRTDMWCHFGHARIHSVDESEADAGRTFDMEEINANLQDTENSPWKVNFNAGVEDLEYEALEETLKRRELKVPPNTRFDYTFVSPTGLRIRFKAIVPDTNGQDGCFSFQDDIVPIKNALADQSSNYKYRLCAPPSNRLKVDILIPYLTFDCHLVLRTKMRKVKDVSRQEEDRILIDFLDKNLKYENRMITLPLDNLPKGFSVKYRRRADRWSYPYRVEDTMPSDYNVMISKEESQEESYDGRGIQDTVEKKNDIHVHSDDWDKMLKNKDWEPEVIVSKLPAFLKFLRDVQQNIRVRCAEVDE